MIVRREKSPSYDRNGGLKSPMVDVSDHTDLPKQVWAKDIAPQALPDCRGNPECPISKGMRDGGMSKTYHSHPRRHSAGEV